MTAISDAARHIVLVGAMGSGKSTIGEPLAAALERPFVDNDVRLAQVTGFTAAQLAERDGIDALHAAEARIVLDDLSDPEASVIAAAASTIADPEVRRRLHREAFVIWLRAAPATLAARLPGSTTRPALDDDAAHLVESQARERDPLFAQLADLAFESDSTTPAVAVARIIENLPGSTRPNR
jgi:shikimate kinase